MQLCIEIHTKIGKNIIKMNDKVRRSSLQMGNVSRWRCFEVKIKVCCHLHIKDFSYRSIVFG